MDPIFYPLRTDLNSQCHSTQYGCEISLVEKGEDYTFLFERAKYLRKLGQSENAVIARHSTPIIILVELFKKFRFAPLRWNLPQKFESTLLDPLAKSKVIKSLHQIDYTNFSVSKLNENLTLKLLPNAHLISSSLGANLEEIHVLSLSTLWSHFSPLSLIQYDGDWIDNHLPYRKKYSLYPSDHQFNSYLSEYIFCCLNHPICIDSKKLNGSIWLNIINEQYHALTDQSALKRMDLSHHILKKRSYDVITFQEDISPALCGLYCWSSKNHGVEVQLVSFYKSESNDDTMYLANFLQSIFKTANVSHRVIHGKPDDLSPWMHVIEKTKSQAQIFLNYAPATHVHQIAARFFSRSVFSMSAFYLRAKKNPALIFTHQIGIECSASTESWTSIGFKLKTIVQEAFHAPSRSSLASIVYVLGDNVSANHHQIVENYPFISSAKSPSAEKRGIKRSHFDRQSILSKSSDEQKSRTDSSESAGERKKNLNVQTAILRYQMNSRSAGKSSAI